MRSEVTRIVVRSHQPATSESADVCTSKREATAVTVHTKIERDAERVRQLIAGNPGYRPAPLDAPHILRLVRAAVKWVNKQPPSNRCQAFHYRGKPYPLLFTRLGVLIVCDSAGNKLGASSYGAVE